MLTGSIPPTKGIAFVNGYDVEKNSEYARKSLGFCPQHSILYDELTVREHLTFYCQLKGMTNKEADMEVAKYVKIMKLESKLDSIAKSLSGGQKKKLSFASKKDFLLI